MKQQKGFTLIELIMVIVILGILAAFALPRFADLSGDAETSSVEGARASVQSSSGIVRAQALVENETGTGPVNIESVDIDLVNGYLAAASVDDMAQLGDFTVALSGTDDSVANITIANPVEDSPCFTFTESTAVNTPPVISAVGDAWNATDSTCDI